MIANLPVFEKIPVGWSALSGAATAPIGYLLISNGKSRFCKEYRCGLVKNDIHGELKLQTEAQRPDTVITQSPKDSKPVEKSGIYFSNEPDLPEKLNIYAREQMKLRLLQDIRMDICVCQLEGIDYKSYLMDLKKEIDQFLNL